MATTSTVCQGLQSCLEPLLLEPRVLMHQFVPSRQGLSFPWPHKQTELPRAENPKNCPIDKKLEINRNGEESLSCWNFTQSVTNPSYSCRKPTDEPEEVYVHPLAKRSTCCLSTESLEMCTESLGSETGSGIDSSIDELSNHEVQGRTCGGMKRQFIKKVKQGSSSSFPPPLTSISGSEGVQVRTHREGGRLVIRAFSVSSRAAGGYFQAERENGRLRISLLRDGGDSEAAENEEEEEEAERGEDVDEPQKDCDDESGEDEDDLKRCFRGESGEDGGGKVGCKIGGGDWPGSRCNGDTSRRRDIPNLPRWVAIS